MRILIILFLSGLFSACCLNSKSEDEYAYLSDENREWLAYQHVDQIQMVHSNGKSIKLEPQPVNTYFDSYRKCFECCDYTTYHDENAEVELVSPNSQFSIKVGVTRQHLLYSDSTKFNVNLSVSKKDARTFNPTEVCDSCYDAVRHDTLIFDQNRYYDVFQFNNHLIDSTVLAATRIFYQKEHGFLKIELSNGEYYQLK